MGENPFGFYAHIKMLPLTLLRVILLLVFTFTCYEAVVKVTVLFSGSHQKPVKS